MFTRLSVRLIWFCCFAFLFRSVLFASPEHGQVSATRSAQLFERFSRLNPPIDAAVVARTLGDKSWIRRAAMTRYTFLTGFIPLRHSLISPGSVFVVELTAPTSSNNQGYIICLHTRAAFPREERGDWNHQNPPAAGLRHFLAGRAPAHIKIDEYSLCYPDGRVLNVLPGSRRSMSPENYRFDPID
jgi:hypothetical protein